MTRTARPVVGSIIAALTLVVVIVACGSTATPAPGGDRPRRRDPRPAPRQPGASSSTRSAASSARSASARSASATSCTARRTSRRSCRPRCAGLRRSSSASAGRASAPSPARSRRSTDDFIGLTGKSMADVSFASASSTGSGDCPDITAFKVNGLDENSLQRVLHDDGDERRQQADARPRSAARTSSRRPTATTPTSRTTRSSWSTPASDDAARPGSSCSPDPTRSLGSTTPASAGVVGVPARTIAS